MGMETPSLTWPRFKSNRPEETEETKRTLYAAFNLSLKTLIDKHACTSSSDSEVYVNQFCTILEQVLRHGLRSNWLQKREIWDLLCAIECNANRSIFDNARACAVSPNGRARAWMRLALMEQNLHDYFSCILECKLSDYYEEWALMRSEQMFAISGLLLGLNSLEFNLCLKGAELDAMSEDIDWSVLLREGNRHKAPAEPVDEQLIVQQKQKTYLEHLNKDNQKKISELNLHINRLAEANEALQKEVRDVVKSKELIEASNRGLLEDMEKREAEFRVEREYFKESKKEIHELELKLEVRSEELKRMNERIAELERDLEAEKESRAKDQQVLKATQQRLVQALKTKAADK